MSISTWFRTRARRAVGPRVLRLGNLGAVVQPDRGDRSLRVIPGVGQGWLVEPRGNRVPREVRQLGGDGLRAHLIADRHTLSHRPRRFQQALARVGASEQIRWLVRALEVDVVFDVGANTGQFGRALRAGGYTGRIVSFEPVAALFAELARAAADDPDWQVHPFALGDETGTTEIHLGGQRLASILPSSDFGRSWSSTMRSEAVEVIEVRRLDEVFAQATAGIAGPRCLLKMDTQGFDLRCFAGLGDRVAEIVALQSEVACVPIYEGMPRYPEALAVYEAAGFELTGMFPITFDTHTLRAIEFDAIMVRAGAYS